MSFLSPSSGQRKPEAVILLPARGHAVRVERESDGEGSLVIARSHGWLWGDLVTALSDARELAADLGVTAWSSAWRTP
jgi:hypothetical protein